MKGVSVPNSWMSGTQVTDEIGVLSLVKRVRRLRHTIQTTFTLHVKDLKK